MRVGHIAQKAARLPLAHSVRANRIGRLLLFCVDTGRGVLMQDQRCGFESRLSVLKMGSCKVLAQI